MEEKTNPCRPGFGASCGLCCGSHNYRAAEEELFRWFHKRQHRPPLCEQDANACLHLHLDHKGLLSCDGYFDQSIFSSEESTFFSHVCRTFYCPAFDILTDDEIKYAAQLLADWYYYPLLIHHPPMLRSLMREFPHVGKISPARKKEIQNHLRAELPCTG